MEINLIRFFCAFICGCLLAISGSLIQGATQNELAGPSTLGINAFVVAIMLVAHAINVIWGVILPLEYLSLILFVSLFLLFIGWASLRRPRKVPTYGNRLSSNITFYILLGLGFNLFVGAVFSVMQFLFMTMDMEFPTEIWYGNFRFTNGLILLILVSVILFVYFWVAKISRGLRILSFGNELAVGMKVNVDKLQRQSIYLSIFSVGVVTSFFGIFAFVGLIFPHLLRVIPAFRSNIQKELMGGSLLCGLLFSLLDLFCAQFDILGAEVPVGMLSAVIGSMLLFSILLSKSLRLSKVD